MAELRRLLPGLRGYRCCLVLNDPTLAVSGFEGPVFHIVHAERNLRVLINVLEAWRLLRRERPQVILTTGAGPAVPFALVGRILGIPTIFVEGAGQVMRPSLSGRLLRLLGADVFYQWPELRRYYPRGVYGGLIWFSSS